MAEKSRKSLADSLLKSVKKATRKDETVYSSKPSKSLVDKPKYTQGQGLGDVELRADLEAYMYGNPLARLGYELYKEGKINIKGIDRLIMPGMLTTPATAKEFTSLPIRLNICSPKKRKAIIIKAATKEAFSD